MPNVIVSKVTQLEAITKMINMDKNDEEETETNNERTIEINEAVEGKVDGSYAQNDSRNDDEFLDEENENDDDDEDDEETEDDEESDDESETEESSKTPIEEVKPPRSPNSVPTCYICLNEFEGQDIGTPENCERIHFFCLECIEEWSKVGIYLLLC